jgi:hypothetical protein
MKCPGGECKPQLRRKAELRAIGRRWDWPKRILHRHLARQLAPFSFLRLLSRAPFHFKSAWLVSQRRARSLLLPAFALTSSVFVLTHTHTSLRLCAHQSSLTPSSLSMGGTKEMAEDEHVPSVP